MKKIFILLVSIFIMGCTMVMDHSQDNDNTRQSEHRSSRNFLAAE